MILCDECGLEYDESKESCPCTWIDPDCNSIYKYATLCDFPSELVEDVRKIISGPTKSGIVYGDTGSGKTHIAIGFAKEYKMIHGYTWRICDNDIPTYPSSKEKWWNDNLKVNFLIIDEFSNEHFNLLNARLQDKNGDKITICTTNMDVENSSEVNKRFGWRLKRFYMRCNPSLDIDEAYNKKIERYQRWEEEIRDRDRQNAIALIEESEKERKEKIERFMMGVTGLQDLGHGASWMDIKTGRMHYQSKI